MSSVYRFYNQKAGGHFFTSSLEERDTIIANVPYFTFEGTAFDTVTPTTAGAVNVYRFYNTLTDSHFYTASEAERDIVLNTAPTMRFEGVGFTAAMAPGEGLEAVYRFYNLSAGVHFFTTDVNERDVVMNSALFRYEGIAFYEHHAGYVASVPAAAASGPVETAGVTFTFVTAGNDLIIVQTVTSQGSVYGDHIEGHGGDVAIYGTYATDEIIAAGGNDTISAGAGDDKVTGSGGSDVLTGGAGNDEFMFFAGDGQDVITDLQQGDHLRFANAQAGTVFIIAADGPPLPGQSGSSFAGYDVIYGTGASQGSIHLDGITFADLGWVQDSFRYGMA